MSPVNPIIFNLIQFNIIELLLLTVKFELTII